VGTKGGGKEKVGACDLLGGSSALLHLLGLLALADKRLVDVGDDTTAGNGGLDESVELLVTTDGELQVAGGDTLDLQVLGGVTGKLEDLSGQVLEDGSAVDGSSSTDTTTSVAAVLEEAVDTADGELEK